MDVRLSPEQQALRDSAAQVVDRLGPRTVAQLGDRERAEKLEAAVRASGWRELRVPEEDGAPLASGVEAAIVAEQLGRGLADAPFVGPTLAAELRRLAGTPASTAPETVVLSSSRVDLAVAVGGRSPEGASAVDADGSASALLVVRAGSGYRLARVPLTSATAGPDLTRPSAAVPPTPVEELDGPQARSLTTDDLSRWTALALALASADLVGTMGGAVDLAVEYASARRQFDRAIGSFQSLQHLLADAYVLTEGSRSVARHAAWGVDALPADDAVDAAAVAKAYCARAARSVCETSIQVHGGIGNTWECLAHVHLRRVLVSSELLGGAGVSLDRVLGHRGIGGSGGHDGLR